jgi:cyclase
VNRTLIVARMDPTDADQVAQLFAESDDTELPRLVGVTRRTLFQYQGLYFHLVEADTPIGTNLANVRENPLYVDLSKRLDEFIKPYDPQTWRGPQDAMATGFYSWQAA